MKPELKSGIAELDNLIEQFENGEINFVKLTSGIWNAAYAAANKPAPIFEYPKWYSRENDCSLRLYNSVKQYLINVGNWDKSKTTIKDIWQFFNSQNNVQIRNFGRKCKIELNDLFIEYGLAPLDHII